MNDGDDRRVPQSEWNMPLLAAYVVGTAVLAVYAWGRPDKSWLSLGVLLLIAGAATAVGVFLGFLFGIPRTVQREPSRTDSNASGEVDATWYGVNTNLEQISDWLTKIIVGVGLVQLTKMPDKARQLGDFLSTAFGVDSVPPAVVLLTLHYFGVFSFLLGYLWTRIYLAGEFSRVESAAREQPEYLEGIIHALLYMPRPRGFEQAIKRGTDYNRRYDGNNSRVWSYLAFAYAQKYSYLKGGDEKDRAQMPDVRANALAALKNAIRIDPESRASLRSAWDPIQAKPGEDDLTVFFSEAADDDFRKVLDRQPGDPASSGE